MSPASNRKARTTLVVFCACLLLYLLTPTANFYWDGITFALQIEKVASGSRDSSLLFHQNHLLYNAAGYLLYRAAQALAVPVRALDLLRIANAFAGAAAVAVLYRSAHRLTGHNKSSVLAASLLATSAVWWKLSTDADAYILSILFVLLAFDNLVSQAAKWYLAGPALGIAMTTHELAALFLPAALLAAWFAPVAVDKTRFLTGLILSSCGLTFGAYYLCAAAFHRLTSPFEVIRWAGSNPAGVSASMNPLPGFSAIGRGHLDLVVVHSLKLLLSHHSLLETGLLIGALLAMLVLLVCVLAALMAKRSEVPHETSLNFEGKPALKPGRVVAIAVVWILVYAGFLLFWEPWQTYYRVFYVPAIAVLVAVALSRLRRSLFGSAIFNRRLTFGLCLVSLGLLNLALFIAPNMRSDSNALVEAARRTGWDDHTVVFFADRNEADTAFEYFNPSSDWHRLSRSTLSGLDSDISATYNQGGNVWLNRSAAKLVGNDWLSARTTNRVIEVEAPNAPALYVEVRPVDGSRQ